MVPRTTVPTSRISTTPRLAFLTMAVATAWLCGLTPLHAAPKGGQVTAGSASINKSGSTTTIDQTSQRAIVNWHSFSVGSKETVRFIQPGTSAVTLNRITGTESSHILGNLKANGQVFILNPNGVLIGRGAQINVGGFLASSLGMTDSNFMSGHHQFQATGTAAAVVNQGNITVPAGGMVALMAPEVRNTGYISAPEGDVLLAAANRVTLQLDNGSLVAYTLEEGAANALVDNGGLIKADGGTVVLSAKAVDAVNKAVVNHSGVIEAQTLGGHSGRILLLSDMKHGEINVTGTLDASAPHGGNGGFIETSAANVYITDQAHITTYAPQGVTGEFLLDPLDIVVANSGGNITPAELAEELAKNNVTIQTVDAGTENGDIFIKNNIGADRTGGIPNDPNCQMVWYCTDGRAPTTLTLKAHRNIVLDPFVSIWFNNGRIDLQPNAYGISTGQLFMLPLPPGTQAGYGGSISAKEISISASGLSSGLRFISSSVPIKLNGTLTSTLVNTIAGESSPPVNQPKTPDVSKLEEERQRNIENQLRLQEYLQSIRDAYEKKLKDDKAKADALEKERKQKVTEVNKELEQLKVSEANKELEQLNDTDEPYIATEVSKERIKLDSEVNYGATDFFFDIATGSPITAITLGYVSVANQAVKEIYEIAANANQEFAKAEVDIYLTDNPIAINNSIASTVDFMIENGKAGPYNPTGAAKMASGIDSAFAAKNIFDGAILIKDSINFSVDFIDDLVDEMKDYKQGMKSFSKQLETGFKETNEIFNGIFDENFKNQTIKIMSDSFSDKGLGKVIAGKLFEIASNSAGAPIELAANVKAYTELLQTVAKTIEAEKTHSIYSEFLKKGDPKDIQKFQLQTQLIEQDKILNPNQARWGFELYGIVEEKNFFGFKSYKLVKTTYPTGL